MVVVVVEEVEEKEVEKQLLFLPSLQHLPGIRPSASVLRILPSTFPALKKQPKEEAAVEVVGWFSPPSWIF